MLLDIIISGISNILLNSNKRKLQIYCQLEGKLDFLRDKVEQLRSKKRCIEMRLKLEESAYKKRTNKVTEWLYKADSVAAEVAKVIAAAERDLAGRQNVCCCPWNSTSSSIVGLSVYDKLEAVNQILTEHDFDVLVERMPRHHVDVIPVATTVDFESDLEDVWRCIEDENLQIIGIFGVPGVGKTTLLEKIKDDLEKRRLDTPAVIWISASKETNMDAIQDYIVKQSKVFRKKWKNANNAADGTRKFILLLDDLWERLDLSKIVVPHLNGSEYKVVFTTRSEAVCDDMADDVKLKLDCLPDDEAHKLFWRNCYLC